MCCAERENEMQGWGMKEIGAGENEITNFRYRMSFSGRPMDLADGVSRNPPGLQAGDSFFFFKIYVFRPLKASGLPIPSSRLVARTLAAFIFCIWFITLLSPRLHRFSLFQRRLFYFSFRGLNEIVDNQQFVLFSSFVLRRFFPCRSRKYGKKRRQRRRRRHRTKIDSS